MSLKKSIRKLIAVFVAMLMLNSNCYMFGLGLSRVIAQDIKEPSINLSLENTQYVQFKEEIEKNEEELETTGSETEAVEENNEQTEKEYNSGVAIKTKVQLGLEEQETQLPIKSSEVVVGMPVLNGFLPERATVVNVSTTLTNVESNIEKINQSYDSTSGLLTVSYKNEETYSNYNKDSKDEFEIIYIYPEQAYQGNEEEISLQYSVSAKVNFETEEVETFSEIVQGFELKEKDNKGSLLTFGVTKLENDIYKGFMYSNLANGTAYDTDYNTVSTLCVLNNNISNQLTMVMEENKFVLNDEENTEISSEGKVLYKATQINKAEFDRIFGQDGVLEIYEEETLLATVKYIEVTENEELIKRLSVIYSDENIKILSAEETAVKVEYNEGVKSLIIKATKPVAEGYINLKNENTIKAAGDYLVDISELKTIRTTSSINDNKGNIELLLLEPQTKISVNSSNLNFSTLQTSKTTLTINLDSTNASTKLFNNPTVIVKLPEGLNGGNLSSPEIVNGNGLTIKNATANNNIITIELEGKQTSYDLTNVSGGASIVMDIDDIDFTDTIPTNTSNIQVTCIQDKEKTQTNCNVNIVSKAGLLVLSKLYGFDEKNSVLTSIDNEIKTVNIESSDEAKQIVQTIDLVNNHNEKITNIEMIGRIGYTNNELKSTFDLEIIKPIEIENAKVYYSNNKDADYNDESWTETFTNEAKAYKIEIDNRELVSKDNLGIKLNLNIPANLYYYQTSYVKTDINYTYNDSKIIESSTIKILTEENNLTSNSSDYIAEIKNENGEEIPVSVIVTPNIVQNYVHSRQRVTYSIKVTNNGTEDLKNIVLEDIIPDNAIYTYVKEMQGNIANYTKIEQNTEIKNKIWNINNLKAGDSAEFEIMLTMADVTEEQEITNSIILKCNNQSITADSKLTLKPAKIETSLITSSEGMLNVQYNTNEEVVYCLNIKNIYNKTLKDIKVKFEIPTTLEYVEGGLASGDLNLGYTIEEQGNINDDIFEYTIGKLKENEEKIICIKTKVKKITNNYQNKITTIAQVNVNEEMYQSNIKTITIKQSDYTVKLKSNITGETILKKGDQVVYTIEVENVGEVSGSVMIKDNIPEQLKVKKVEEYVNNELRQSIDTAKQNVEWTSLIEINQKSIVKVFAEVALVESETMENIEVINRAIIIFGESEINSNEEKIVIQPELRKVENNDGYNPEDFEAEAEENEEKDETTSEGNTNVETEQPKSYEISGSVWLDFDKNGVKNDGESFKSNIIVTLINMATGDFAIDINGNKITTKTDVQGKYTFNNLTAGAYAVMFEYDTQNYTVTTYQKEGIKDNENSDAILSTVNINGRNKVVALTDKIELSSNKENIDLGLIENPIFDLSLNKEITEITVIDKQGTETYEYKDGHTAKVDLVAKYMSGTNVIVNYKFTITNNGEIAGYVNSLMDSLPSGLEFSSELNNNWYKGSDGNLYTTSLSGKTIKPGESIDVDLVLTKTMTEENAGTFVNNAKLEKISNLEEIKEKESAIENNESSAILIISIKTGSAILYVGITMICLAIISIGIYFIKKKVLMRII